LFVAVILASAPNTMRADDAKSVGRIFHSMVWMGREVLVWGGGSEGVFHDTGSRIEPEAGSRAVISDKGAPSSRWGHAAVWSGTEMLVWGGRAQFQADAHFVDGGRYNPVTDNGRRSSRSGRRPHARRWRRCGPAKS
jgi:hypothetical protein